jgi:hypothetical protein
MYESSLEPAINPHSCALACLVSICRHYGKSYTQTDLVENFTPKYPDWREKPGSLVLERLINFSCSLLGTRSHVVTTSKELIIRNWQTADRIGAFLITARQRDSSGQWIAMNHAWRVLDCDEYALTLMNPAEVTAEVIRVDWSFISTFGGYALILLGLLENPSDPVEHYK